MHERNLKVDDDFICLDNKYSTTRMITRQKQVIENKPGDSFETMLLLPRNTDRTGEGGLRTRGYFKKNMPGKPLITVITVVLNCEKHLEKAIQSVLNQTYDNVEYIIVDGCSTDGTLDIIRQYEDRIDYWISEKDDGLYHAMNKGITLATGDIIGLVNADDIIYDSTLEAVVNVTLNNQNLAYTFGDVDLMGDKGKVFGRSIPLSKDLITARLYREMPYRHLSVFVAKHVYKTLGLFDTLFRIRADYDFLIRVISAGFTGHKIPTVVGAQRWGGVSDTMETYFETRRLLKKHKVSAWKKELYFFESLIKIAFYLILPRNLIYFLRKFRTSMNIYYPDS